MDFDLNEEQRLLNSTVERFVQNRYANGERAAYIENSMGYCAHGWQIMAETGICALPFSRQFNGLDGTIQDIACVIRSLGNGTAVEPIISNLLLGGWTLDAAGTTEQKQCWLPRVASGEAQMALAHSEHAARYNLSHVSTQAKGDAEAKLSGEKTFVLGGNPSAYIVSASRSTPGNEPTDFKLYFVKADAKGLKRRTYRLMDGSVACELRLHDTPAESMEGDFVALMQVIDKTKVAICAEMVGVMEFLFEQTIDYLKTREQFGQPLGSFQSIQHRMADQYTKLELSRSQMFRAISVKPSQPDYARVICGAKAYISDAAQKLAEECVQFHGGMGVTDELMIGHGLKRVLVLGSMFGDMSTELRRYRQ